MLQTTWKSGSMRVRVAIATAVAVLPLAVSAVLGYVILDRGVVTAYRDVAIRQKNQINPAQRLQSALLQAEDRVGDYVVTHDLAYSRAYRDERERIEADFVRLHGAFGSQPEVRTLVERARDDWSTADHLATQVLAMRSSSDPHATNLLEQFQGEVKSSVDKLDALYNDLDSDLSQDYFAAHLAYERTEWIAAIAAAVSFLMIFVGVAMFGRLIRSSVDRLVDGAARFAAGERDHRIEVQVPPELKKVADEFNRMIGRIHESESALAEQARRDGLTGLSNRRAFDEAIEDAFARMERLDERIALLIIDLDHFKHINDTYGHGAGDGVLRATIQTVLANLRTIDRAFRIGGEEFAVLLPGADSLTAQSVAERLRNAIEVQPIRVDGHEIPVTVSIGAALASAPHPGRVARLMKAADEALYQAKNAGRNRSVVAPDMYDAIRDELTSKTAS